MKFSSSKIYFNSQKKRICYGIFLLFVICGIVSGTIFITSADNLKIFERLLFTHNIFKTKNALSFVLQFCRSFMPFWILLLIELFSGYSAFGQVFTVLTLVFRGMASGISAAFIYMNLGVKGFLAVLAFAVPFAAASAAVLIVGARESVRQSNNIADFAFYGNRAGDAPPDTKLYLLKFGVLSVFALLISLLDTVITYFFKDMFF